MNTVPFHYDYVGSFLRPEKLKQAREAGACKVLAKNKEIEEKYNK